MYSNRKKKPVKATPPDYPKAIKGDQQFIDGLLEMHPKQKRFVPVQNIHEDRVLSGIEPGKYGLVNRHDHAIAFGWLKQVEVTEPAKAKPKAKPEEAK